MNPMQDQDFMGQMASFSTLEQVTNMAKANETIAANSSVGLLGRTVTWTDERQGGAHRRRREGQPDQDGKTVLTISGTAGVDPTKITQIA